MGMILTDEQQAILVGAKGETMAKVMKTLVMYGDAFRSRAGTTILSHPSASAFCSRCMTLCSS